ncbi:P-loop NTPase fold protein [Micromonospora matsumotoense]|uniref:KAP family P-loop NTPase fold protein n=1 Tax=Micromonospora matsumotoense TaxID=121616 RepID=UPI0034158901
MWPDNETNFDLLGFEFLVDSLVIVLSEPRLLPLTVGVLGDWGSGKSSLMSLACAELKALSAVEEAGDDSRSRYVCVQFSPWRYEDYEDVKVSLMSAVLSQLATEVPQRKEEIGRLKALGRRLRRQSRRVVSGGLELVPTAVPTIAGFVDPSLDPELVKMAQQTAQIAVSAAGPRTAEDPAGPADDGETITTVDEFRSRFATLVNSLDEVAAVVVFIDDLDRCLPETVVDTFEAIRLLLGAPRTAFVLAAHQKVVESAVDARYPALRDDNGSGIGAQYLEKMFQQKITVPALAVPEAVTYVNLLLAELHLDRPSFQRVRDHVAAQRAAHTLEVVFTLGTLGELDVNVPTELVADLQWAAAIAPVLASGSRGNPRQIKQFLNTLQLRRRSAARRKVSLDPAVLAKLMLLEQQHFAEFQQLFDWQIDSGGPSCPQLTAAEHLRRSDTAPQPDQDPAPSVDAEGGTRATRPRSRAPRQAAAPPVDEAVQQWANRPPVRDWLALSPQLASVDLRPYFTYSRDRLSLAAVSIARLSSSQQRLLGQLLGTIDPVRRAAIGTLATAEPTDRDAVIEALARALLTTPEDAFVAVCETAARIEDSREVLFTALDRLPVAAVPAVHVPTAGARLPISDPRTVTLLDKWAASGRAELTGMVALVRRTSSRTGR